MRKLGLLTAAAVLAVVMGFNGAAQAEIGEIKPDSIFTPTPNGIGRAVAFDGLTTLYYTFVGDKAIYKATTLGVSLGPIPDPGPRNFTCGALSFDGTNLWCGTYDGTGMGGAGTGDVWTVNPTTGVANFEFTQAFNNTGCFFAGGFIDGLAFDPSDGSLWLSDDGDTEIFHVDQTGAAIGASPFATPTRPGGVGPGCNSGIEVAPGGFLELVLIAFEPGNGDAGDQVSHFIVKVPKDDISGTPIVSFPTQDPACCEDEAFDAKSFAPRAVVWANATDNEIKAYDVQVTRTIGYWKNHPAEDFDGTSFLPIDLGVNSADQAACDIAANQADVEEILKAHKGRDIEAKLFAQLLAAELNLAMGDIPPGDLAAILPVIDAAHELLGRNECDPDTGKNGADRVEAQGLHALLDAFNNKYSP